MKKTLCLLVALFTILSALPALADGKIKITQEAFYVTPFLTYFAGEVHCEVTNNTNKTMYIDGGVYELFDADEGSIGSGSLYSFYPKTLLPGEKSYFSFTESVKEATATSDIADYSVSITTKTASDEPIRYEVSNVEMRETSGLLKFNEFNATVTNNTDALTKDIVIVFAAYNADGKFLFCTSAMSMGVKLHPGSSVDIACRLQTDILNIIAANGDTVEAIDALAFSQ